MATIGSLEVVVLQRNSCLICETIVNCADIVWFANRITEEVFLTSQAKSSILRTTGISDFEKCSRLISAVETQVKVAPSKYFKFISILQEEPVMQSVVTVLSESYELQSKMQKAPLLLKQLSQGSTQSVTSSNSSGRASPSTVGMSIPELAGELALLITDLVELLDKYDGALGRMKVALENLVLPLSLKKLVHIVRSQEYKEATSVQELFKLLAPYWNCIDCNLLRVIVRASGCQPAIERLDKFLHRRSAISPSLVLYSPTRAESSKGDISKGDTLSDENEADRVIVNQPIQSPAKSSMEESQCTSIPNQPTEEKSDLKKESSVKVEAKVDTDFLTLKDYDEKTSLLCGVLRLPRFALSYLRLATGCVLLTWQMSVDLVQYVQSIQPTDSDLLLLAKHGFSFINIANSYHIAIPNSSFWEANNDDEPCSEEVGEKLLEACKAGNLDTVFCHLDSGVDVNFRNEHGETALILASAYGHEDIVEVLLNSHASVDLEDVEWHTALHTASYYGNVDIVHMLLQAGADANVVNKFGNTALLVASYMDHWNIVRTLLDAGAHINVKNMAGKTAHDIAVECEHWQVVEMLMEADTKQSELLDACNCGDSQAVQYLLQSGADPNCHDKDGNTPLMFAVLEGHIEVVPLLLDADAAIDHQNHDGLTAVYVASYKGHDQILELLLRRKPDVNLQTKGGWTSLMSACEEQHVLIINMLIDNGAHVNQQTEGGWTPLMLACKTRHVHIVNMLISNDAHVNLQNKNGVSALMIACSRGDNAIVQLLLNNNANINHQALDGWTPLMIACRERNVDIVNMLIDNDAEVNLQTQKGNTVLCTASYDGHDKIVELLLRSKADVNHQTMDGWTPLMIASQQGHIHVVSMLMDNGAHVNLQNKMGHSALMIACSEGYTAIVQLLLKNDLNSNLQALHGETALGYASKFGHTDTVALLVKAGADVNPCALSDLSPLMLATQEGHADIVELLIENHADLDMQNKHGFTALMCAVRYGRMEVVRLLVCGKTNINIQEQEAGRTALMFAAEDGNMEAVKLLISAGADVNIRDKNGITAADVAEASGHEDLSKELMAHSLSRQDVRHTDDVEANKRKARILQTTNLLNTLMQALEYKLEMMTSENEEQPKKGIASVEDIIKGHQDVYPVIQPPLKITEDPERKLSVSSNETDTIEEKESSSKETNEGEVSES